VRRTDTDSRRVLALLSGLQQRGSGPWTVPLLGSLRLVLRWSRVLPRLL